METNWVPEVLPVVPLVFDVGPRCLRLRGLVAMCITSSRCALLVGLALCCTAVSCSLSNRDAQQMLLRAFEDSASADIRVEGYENATSSQKEDALSVDLSPIKATLADALVFEAGPYPTNGISVEHTDIIYVTLHGRDGIARRVELSGGDAITFWDGEQEYHGTLRTKDLESLLLTAVGDM